MKIEIVHIYNSRDTWSCKLFSTSKFENWWKIWFLFILQSYYSWDIPDVRMLDRKSKPPFDLKLPFLFVFRCKYHDWRKSHSTILQSKTTTTTKESFSDLSVNSIYIESVIECLKKINNWNSLLIICACDRIPSVHIQLQYVSWKLEY